MPQHYTNPLPNPDAGSGTSVPTNVRGDGSLDIAPPPAQTISDAPRPDGVSPLERSDLAAPRQRGISWLMTALLLTVAAAAIVWSYVRNIHPAAPRIAPQGEMIPDRTPGRPAP